LRKLRSVVTFHRARQLLREDRVDTAAEMFEQAEQLGGFGDDVPDDLRSGHLVLGTRALFEEDLRTARAQFEGLVATVRTGSSPDTWMGAMAELGLALAAWIEQSPGAATAVEGGLTDVVRRLDAGAATEEAWPDAPDGPSLIEKLRSLDQANADDDRQAKPTRLLRDIHFLRGMAVLRAWVEAENPAQERDTMFPRATCRFACARRLRLPLRRSLPGRRHAPLPPRARTGRARPGDRRAPTGQESRRP
jgi:hypothetical protein